mgnify:CR=1 FL=1
MRNHEKELYALCRAIVMAQLKYNFDDTSCRLLLAYAYGLHPELRKLKEEEE